MSGLEYGLLCRDRRNGLAASLRMASELVGELPGKPIRWRIRRWTYRRNDRRDTGDGLSGQMAFELRAESRHLRRQFTACSTIHTRLTAEESFDHDLISVNVWRQGDRRRPDDSVFMVFFGHWKHISGNNRRSHIRTKIGRNLKRWILLDVDHGGHRPAIQLRHGTDMVARRHGGFDLEHTRARRRLYQEPRSYLNGRLPSDAQ